MAAMTPGDIIARTGAIGSDALAGMIACTAARTVEIIADGIAGGVLGNVSAPGGSETLGTLLGAAGGALAGRAIDRDAKCK
jgi:hypothetical protein